MASYDHPSTSLHTTSLQTVSRANCISLLMRTGNYLLADKAALPRIRPPPFSTKLRMRGTGTPLPFYPSYYGA